MPDDEIVNIVLDETATSEMFRALRRLGRAPVKILVQEIPGHIRITIIHPIPGC